MFQPGVQRMFFHQECILSKVKDNINPISEEWCKLSRVKDNIIFPHLFFSRFISEETGFFRVQRGSLGIRDFLNIRYDPDPVLVSSSWEGTLAPRRCVVG